MRSTRYMALSLTTALSFAVACGSGAKKTVLETPSDGGEAGAALVEGGGAGALEPGAAGEGGSLDVAEGGDAGTKPVGEGGAAGAEALACEALGSVTGLSFVTKTYDVCRGASALVEFSVTDSEQQYTCCGASTAGYVVSFAGVSDNDGGGIFTFTVPANAALGAQSINADCEEDPDASSVNVNVTDAASPVVTSAPASVHQGENLTVTGTNLLAVNRMLIIPVDPSNEQHYCNVNSALRTATSVTCKTSSQTPPGEYRIATFAASCGAQNVPVVEFIPAE